MKTTADTLRSACLVGHMFVPLPWRVVENNHDHYSVEVFSWSGSIWAGFPGSCPATFSAARVAGFFIEKRWSRLSQVGAERAVATLLGHAIWAAARLQ